MNVANSEMRRDPERERLGAVSFDEGRQMRSSWLAGTQRGHGQGQGSEALGGIGAAAREAVTALDLEDELKKADRPARHRLIPTALERITGKPVSDG